MQGTRSRVIGVTAVLLGTLAATSVAQQFSAPLPAGRSSPFTVQSIPTSTFDSAASHVNVHWGPCITAADGSSVGQIHIDGVINGRNIVKTRDIFNPGRAQAIVPWSTTSSVSFGFDVTLDDGTTKCFLMVVNMYFGSPGPTEFEDVGTIIDAGGNMEPIVARNRRSPTQGK
jgi:hypothetical protein